jgi:hypothetical protein
MTRNYTSWPQNGFSKPLIAAFSRCSRQSGAKCGKITIWQNLTPVQSFPIDTKTVNSSDFMLDKGFSGFIRRDHYSPFKAQVQSTFR